MTKALDRIFGPRLAPEDAPESDPDLEEQRREHRETLLRVNTAVSGQRRVAVAAQSVADALVGHKKK